MIQLEQQQPMQQVLEQNNNHASTRRRRCSAYRHHHHHHHHSITTATATTVTTTTNTKIRILNATTIPSDQPQNEEDELTVRNHRSRRRTTSWSNCRIQRNQRIPMTTKSSSLSLLVSFIQLLLLFLLVVSVRTSTADTPIPTTNTKNTNSNTNTHGIDLFDTIDSNHDHMIDRDEFDIGINHFIVHLNDKLPETLRIRQLDKESKSFTSWLVHDIFSYTVPTVQTTTTTGGTGAAAGAAITTTTTTVSIWVGYWKAFTSSLAMILATEIGDKTFFIAAILSMKHSRSIIFCGAIAALTIMTIISTALGLVLPKLLDRKYTHLLSGLLFLYFGGKLIYDAQQMESGKVSEELEEVEEELLHKNKQLQLPKKTLNKKKGDDDIESSGGNNSNNNNNTSSSSTSNALMTTYYTIFVMSFTLTFVAEWGDRSQIATIALASAKNPIGVTIGCIIGHSICTASACIGGRILASNISEKTVSQYGGIIFLLFGFHSLFFES